jgi:predicted dehydrogenase
MIKVGVTGTGETALRHLKVLQALKGFGISGIWDPAPGAEVRCKKWGIPCFRHYEELLRNSDVIDLASLQTDHFLLASKAIKRSKHLFIDRTGFSSPEEVLRLIELSREADVKVQVHYPERFNPAYNASLPYLTNPLYIEAQRHTAFADENRNIPVVMELMMHDIDIILSIVKANIRTVHATGVNVFNGTPDIVNANLEFDNGVVANLTANRIAAKNIRRIKFYQHKGRVQTDFLKNRVKILRKQDNKLHMKNLKTGHEDKLFLALSSFYDHLIRNKTPVTGLEHAYQNLKAAFLINEKIEMLSP